MSEKTKIYKELVNYLKSIASKFELSSIIEHRKILSLKELDEIFKRSKPGVNPKKFISKVEEFASLPTRGGGWEDGVLIKKIYSNLEEFNFLPVKFKGVPILCSFSFIKDIVQRNSNKIKESTTGFCFEDIYLSSVVSKCLLYYLGIEKWIE